MAEAKTQSRQSARSAAEAPAKAPKPRAEADTSTTQPAAEAKPDVPLCVVSPNPKRANSIAHGFFEKYGKVGELTTHRECLERGVRGKDVSWDSDPTRRHILLGDDAVAFSKITDRDEKAAFLRNLGVKDASLIKWGYMDKPEPAPAAEAKTEEKATA